MPSLAEVHRALYGAALLAKFDRDGMNAFGTEAEDAARSFFAAVIVAPMYLVWVLLYGDGYPEDTPFIFAFVFECLAYAVGWMIFPLVIWYLSPVLGCRDRFFHFLAAYNWAAVVQNALFMGTDLLFWVIGAPDMARGFFGLILFAYVLMYGWFVARHGLGLPGGPAATVVALDIAVTMFWEMVTTGMVHG